MQAYGWHVQHIEDGNHDVKGITEAIEKAKLIQPAFNYKNFYNNRLWFTNKSAGIHGAAVGEEEAALTRGFKLGIPSI